MIVLGIDQSLSSTGFAILDYKTENEFKYIRFGTIKTDKDTLPENKMIEIANFLIRICSEYFIDYIVMEDLMTPRINSMTTVQRLSGLFYVLLVRFTSMAYLVLTPKPSEWKKTVGVIGKNRAEQKKCSIAMAKDLLKRGKVLRLNDIRRQRISK